MHFVVIGGAGFIGSHITEQLLAEGYAVTVVDNLSTGQLGNLPYHPQVRFLKKNVFACQPEDFIGPIHGVVHLVATPSVTQSWLNPLEAHHNNLSSTVTVLQLCQTLRIPRLVFASSAAVYGDKIQMPTSEEQETNPVSPYGLQKLASEHYINLLTKQFDLSSISLRMFNVFGPRQQPCSSYSGVISIFTQAMQRNLPITIYGDGHQTRDFIYVKDVARAFVQALTVPLPIGSTFSCNVGTGSTTSLLELVHILRRYFPDWKSEIQFSSPRPGDIQHSQANISKIMNLLNFTPQWSVESGLQLLVESTMPVVSH